MTQANFWWMLAGAAVVVELLTGTFYLLMVALGLAAAALAATGGATLAIQVATAAVVGGGSAAALTYRRRLRAQQTPAAEAQKDMNLDVGEAVWIEHWQPDGSAQVRYRGAQWVANARPGVELGAGSYRIVELVGNRLLVEKV